MKPSKIDRVEEPEFRDIKGWFDENLNAENCDLDDQEVYKKVYEDGNWAAVFQMTEKGMQRFSKKAKPKSIVDLAAVTSIYRPGPLGAKVDKAYVVDKEKVESGGEVEYEHPIIERVLSKTYGHMVFQEDFMLLGKELGKLSWDDCDRLRKILVKKSIGTDVNDEKQRQALEIKERFVKGAVENGMSRPQVEELWTKMQFFSGYGFNLCLHEDTPIEVVDRACGAVTQVPISRVEVGMQVLTCDQSTGAQALTEVIEVHDSGEQDVYEYEFDDGRSVVCTPFHKFRTTCGQMLPIHVILEDGLDVEEW